MGGWAGAGAAVPYAVPAAWPSISRTSNVHALRLTMGANLVPVARRENPFERPCWRVRAHHDR